MIVKRADVIAYRAAVHGLTTGTQVASSLLGAGVQDHPTGASAKLALSLRGHDGSGGVLVHAARAAIHLHQETDLGLLAGALRMDDGRDLAVSSVGPLGAALGSGFSAGMDAVASAMAAVMADGESRTKGELSTAVTPRVPDRLVAWCQGCGAAHVQDALFRYSTLQAGLTLDAGKLRTPRFTGPHKFQRWEPDIARAELVRRYLHLAGPVTWAQVASWLALSPASGKKWWSLVADELTQVTVDRGTAWVHADDAGVLADPPRPDPIRLLGPYDPLTEFADRELAVPNAVDRRRVWSAAANPGVVALSGDIAGIWRRRLAGKTLTLTITPFDSLPRTWDSGVEADADAIGAYAGARDVCLVVRR